MTTTSIGDAFGLGSGTIAELRAALVSGALSPVAVMEATLARIEREDPVLRAWVHVDAEGALRAAAAAEVTAGPLAGVPFGVKDVIDVRGMPTRFGTSFMPATPVAFDAWCVAAVRAAGAIPVGKLATTAFAFRDPAVTRNPWDLARTPGGSSAGSGVSVGARQLPFAFGTQTGGSTLRPAAYNGAVGFIATPGKIPTAGMGMLAPTFDHVGIICRTAHDAATLFAVYDPSAPAASAPAPLRIGYARGYQTRFVESDVTAMIDAMLDGLGSIAGVREVDLPQAMLDSGDAWDLVLTYEGTANLGAALEGKPVPAGLRDMLERGRSIERGSYERALRAREPVIAEFARLFERVDVLAMATAGRPPEPSTTGTDHVPLQLPATSLGLPAISLPAGLTPDGIPIGLQLVGRPGTDAALLATACLVAEELGFENPGPRAFWEAL